MAKRIGILTSGGDCPGLNAVVRAVVNRAVGGHGWTVIGIRNGTAGLLRDPPQIEALKLERFDGRLLREAGTFLGTTNRGNPFAYPLPGGGTADRSDEINAAIRALQLDAVIGIGGDGSQAILKRLADRGGWDLVAIPKTIDNDIGATEVAVGYDTAVEVAVEALDRLQPTAASHQRVMILEVMGRDAGHIALAAGIAGGADAILIPEVPYTLDAVTRQIETALARKAFALMIVAEAVKTDTGEAVTTAFGGGRANYGGIGYWLGDALAGRLEAEVRVTVLGHLQRGGTPSPRDRLMASIFGVHAVDLIARGRTGRMVGWSNRQVIDVPIEEAIATYRSVEVDGPLMRTARALGIGFGDGP